MTAPLTARDWGLHWDASPAHPRAVVVVLHGGQEQGTEPNTWWRAPVLWLAPFAWVARRAGRGRFAVARVRFAVRGWNGPHESPLHDARAALDDVAARYPGVPVALVGHSMGGRVGLRLLGDERVRLVVGLAPWVEGSDVEQGLYAAHGGVRLLVLHGLADRVTSPKASRRVVERLRAGGTDASWVGLDREKHTMVRRRLTWDRLLAAELRTTLLGEGPGRLRAAERRALEPGSATTL